MEPRAADSCFLGDVGMSRVARRTRAWGRNRRLAKEQGPWEQLLEGTEEAHLMAFVPEMGDLLCSE